MLSILKNIRLRRRKRASQVVLVVKNSPANARDLRDVGSTPVSGRSSGVQRGNPLRYSYLGKPMDREPGRLQSMGSQSRTRLKRLSTQDLGCKDETEWQLHWMWYFNSLEIKVIHTRKAVQKSIYKRKGRNFFVSQRGNRTQKRDTK